jgi:hypothetical protein
MVVNPFVPDGFQHRKGGHHIHRPVQLIIAGADQINLHLFIMAMGDETPAALKVKQTVAHAVSAGKTYLKAHDWLDNSVTPMSPDLFPQAVTPGLGH